MPPAAVRERFGRLIDALSQRLGTPRFHPHVTLCGTGDYTEADVRARTAALAARLAPVPIHLTEVGYTEEYFRCLYIKAERSPALLAAHATACAHFGRPAVPDFMPHLSLVYGELSREQKEKIIAEIGRRFDLTFCADAISLCWPAGTPESWRVLGPFPLTGVNETAGRRTS